VKKLMRRCSPRLTATNTKLTIVRTESNYCSNV